jgi:hypothetical protein
LEQAELIIEAQKTIGDIGNHAGTGDKRGQVRATVTEIAEKITAKRACERLGYPRSSYYRQQQEKAVGGKNRSQRESPRALAGLEREVVRETPD